MNALIVSKSQPQIVREHLQQGKAITPAQALLVYGISRLAPAIERLRDSGMAIDTTMREDEVGKRYASYSLRRPIEVNSKVQVVAGAGIGLPRWVRKLAGGKVVSKFHDSSLVEFTKGAEKGLFWLNDKELVNVG